MARANPSPLLLINEKYSDNNIGAHRVEGKHATAVIIIITRLIIIDLCVMLALACTQYVAL